MSESFTAEYSDAEVKVTPDPKPDVTVETPKPEPTPEPAELSYQEQQEQIASASGWAPKEEWKGDPKEWVSAEIFNVRGPFFEKIKSQKDELLELRRAHENFAEQQKTMMSIMEKTRADERAKTIKELKEKKTKLLEEGNFAEVVETDAEIAEASKPEEKLVVQQQPAGDSKVLKEFTDNNMWYFKEAGMREYADAKGRVYIVDNPNAKPEDVLKHMETVTKEAFPEHFQTAPNQSPVGDQPSENLPNKGKVKKMSKRDLDDTHKDILRMFVSTDNTGRSDAEIEDAIIKEWQEIGEL